MTKGFAVLALGGGILLGDSAADGDFPPEWLGAGWVLGALGLALFYRFGSRDPVNRREEAESTTPLPPRQSTRPPE